MSANAVHQETLVHHALDQICHEIGGGLAIFRHEFEAEEQAGAADVGQPRVADFLKTLQGAGRTERAAAADTGLPPNVLKYSNASRKVFMVCGVVIAAETGCPLASGLPMVTMSGARPIRSWAQKWLPERPSPD